MSTHAYVPSGRGTIYVIILSSNLPIFALSSYRVTIKHKLFLAGPMVFGLLESRIAAGVRNEVQCCLIVHSA